MEILKDLGLPIVNGVILLMMGFFGGWIRAKFSNAKKEELNIKAGVLALLHDRLYQACSYHINCKCISPQEMRNLEKMYNAYKALGGNGTIKEMYERCMNLRICFKEGESHENQ